TPSVLADEQFLCGPLVIVEVVQHLDDLDAADERPPKSVFEQVVSRVCSQPARPEVTMDGSKVTCIDAGVSPCLRQDRLGCEIMSAEHVADSLFRSQLEQDGDKGVVLRDVAVGHPGAKESEL